MKELGFFMDDKGNIKYYGEWKEQYDKNNRHEVHETSFVDEVESLELFQKLKLDYNLEMGIHGKGVVFALQGMVLMLNLSSKDESKFMMYVPQKLSDLQRESFTNLYSLLSSFENINIVVTKSLEVDDDDVIDSVDYYYEQEGIFKGLYCK